jgi:hypothetical protein
MGHRNFKTLTDFKVRVNCGNKVHRLFFKLSRGRIINIHCTCSGKDCDPNKVNFLCRFAKNPSCLKALCSVNESIKYTVKPRYNVDLLLGAKFSQLIPKRDSDILYSILDYSWFYDLPKEVRGIYKKFAEKLGIKYLPDFYVGIKDKEILLYCGKDIFGIGNKVQDGIFWDVCKTIGLKNFSALFWCRMIGIETEASTMEHEVKYKFCSICNERIKLETWHGSSEQHVKNFADHIAEILTEMNPNYLACVREKF